MKFVICLVALVVVAVADKSQSHCQKWRENALKSTIIGAIVPECEDNGDFAALQCHQENFCQCWNRDGTPLTRPSKNIKACECLRQREDARFKDRIGAFVPNCKASGHFEARQCHASTGMCWCSDEQGKQLSEPTRDVASVNC